MDFDKNNNSLKIKKLLIKEITIEIIHLKNNQKKNERCILDEFQSKILNKTHENYQY